MRRHIGNKVNTLKVIECGNNFTKRYSFLGIMLFIKIRMYPINLKKGIAVISHISKIIYTTMQNAPLIISQKRQLKSHILHHLFHLNYITPFQGRRTTFTKCARVERCHIAAGPERAWSEAEETA